MAKVFIIDGNPTPLARPRFNSQNGTCYDSQKMGKIHARLFLEKQQGNEPRLSGPLALYVTFFMPIPKSLPQRKRLAMENLPHQIRPDLDNLLKWVGDISNELLFNDDCTIALISSRKIYSMAPRTVFTLVSLKSLDLHDEPFINAFGDK